MDDSDWEIVNYKNRGNKGRKMGIKTGNTLKYSSYDARQSRSGGTIVKSINADSTGTKAEICNDGMEYGVVYSTKKCDRIQSDSLRYK